MTANQLQLTTDEPTTIVRDFFVFLNYMKQQPIKLTKSKQQLTKKDLQALYALLPNLGLEVGPNSTHGYYPTINLFVELAQKLMLLKKNYHSSSSHYVVDATQLQAFEQLTLAEQYVSLLQCFWLHADWDALQGALYAQKPLNIDFLFPELQALPPNETIRLKQHPTLGSAVATYGHFLLYFQYFGFWEVALDHEITPKTKVQARSLQVKPFLLPLIPILVNAFTARFDEAATGTAQFIDALKPLFEKGQLQSTLQPQPLINIEGEYVFKVAYNAACWRTIALSDTHTLLDLHNWIQRAFAIADDHLYAFYMDNLPFSSSCYNSPNDMEGPYVDEVTLGDLYLQEGQQFLYLFDFGDEWHFRVTVANIHENRVISSPGIRKENGAPPQQYY